MSLLECNDLRIGFGSILAIDDLSFRVSRGELLSIVGPNGAGKTSLFNLINGFYKPNRGSIQFEGEDITWLPPWKRARLGLSRTFQKERVFPSENIVVNITTIRGVSHSPNLLESMLWFGPGRRKEVENVEFAEEIIDFLDLEPHRHNPVATLPLEVQRRVSLARALALEPNLLLLDEIMSGLTFDEKYSIVRYLLDIQDEKDVTIVMIEHDLEVVTNVSERMIVLNDGRLLADGDPDDVAERSEVKRVYSGGVQ